MTNERKYEFKVVHRWSRKKDKAKDEVNGFQIFITIIIVSVFFIFMLFSLDRMIPTR